MVTLLHSVFDPILTNSAVKSLGLVGFGTSERWVNIPHSHIILWTGHLLKHSETLDVLSASRQTLSPVCVKDVKKMLSTRFPFFVILLLPQQQNMMHEPTENSWG